MSGEAHNYLRGRVRALTIGLSIGTRYGSAGCTLGVFVKDKDGRVGFLTSAIGLGVQCKEEVVYQPSALDAGTLAFRDIVGHVKEYTIANVSQRSYADAALVRLAEGIEVAGNSIPMFPRSDVAEQVTRNLAPDIGNLKAGTRVAKVGRTSGYTEGTITAVELSNITIGHNSNVYIFDEIIEISSPIEAPFSMFGDAGSVVFSVTERLPIGLVFAGGKRDRNLITFACRLDRVIDMFNVELL